MEILILCLLSITVMFFVLGLIFLLNRDKLLIQERLDTYTQELEKANLLPELNQPFGERLHNIISQVFIGISRKVVPSKKKEVWEKRLLAAGNPCNMNAETFLLFKYLILLSSVCSGLLIGKVLYLIFFIVLGFLIPNFYLRSKAKRRQELILKSLPDVLDLLCVSVEAGLGFDAALQKVIEKYKGPLSNEFEKTLQEINVGKARREALRDMAERVGVDDVKTFLASIIQAEQLGVSVTNVLRLQSGQVRADRRMRAEEKAQQAPVKILIPLVIFIFPTILIVLLGPAVIQMLDTFGR